MHLNLSFDERNGMIYSSITSEEGGLDMMLLILGWGPECDTERSRIRRFLPEYFRVAMPRGLDSK